MPCLRPIVFIIMALITKQCEGVYEHIRRPLVSSLASSFSTSAPLLFVASSDVTAFVNHSALLMCTVDNAGDKVVSWMKDNELKVIASGQQVFARDPRFSVQRDGHVWILRIRFVRLQDHGQFQCQVNSEPKVSRRICLNVKEARAVLEGDRDRYVRLHSRVEIMCSVNLTTSSLQSSKFETAIFWYLNNAVLSSSEIVEQTDTWVDDVLTSRLVIRNVSEKHVGILVCSPFNALSDQLNLHVLAREASAKLRSTDLLFSRGSNLNTPCMIIIIMSFLIHRSNECV